MVSITPLTFDTTLLKLPVARLDGGSFSLSQAENALSDARVKGIKLVYWMPKTLLPAELCSRYGGHLVDHKTTYTHAVAEGEAYQAATDPPFLFEGKSEELEELAIASGWTSRFAVDPLFPQDAFEMMYRLWMRGSVEGRLADAVFVAKEKDVHAGMVTLSEKEGRGQIGLLAVGQAHRKKGYGRQLVNAALEWTKERGLSIAEVVTQRHNKQACRLYESCGYSVENVTLCYHFWL